MVRNYSKFSFLILNVFVVSCVSRPPVKNSPGMRSGQENHFPLKASPETPKGFSSETPPLVNEKKSAVPVGVWIDGAGVESFAALGFLQELEKSDKIKVVKVNGTGLGCWIAVSWALENSNNRAEWQATKLSDWESMGRGGSLLTRISGGRADYSKFKSEMNHLLTVTEFRGLARETDCPLLNTRTGVLESARSLGIYKALWTQMTTPLIGLEDELKNASQISGVLGIRPRPRELDEFSNVEKNSSQVRAWIVLSLDSMQILSDDRDVLRDTLMRRFVDSTQGASVTPAGRPVMVTVPAFDLSVKTARDFSQRRNFLLQGRKYAERFLSQPWIDRIQDSGSGLENDSPR